MVDARKMGQRMSATEILVVLEILVGLLITLVAVGGVPWALRVQTKLTQIATKLESREWQDAELTRLRNKIQTIEVWQARRDGNDPPGV